MRPVVISKEKPSGAVNAPVQKLDPFDPFHLVHLGGIGKALGTPYRLIIPRGARGMQCASVA